MTADDYFAMNRYDGKIYKTTNLQGLALANYCKTDSALAKEQKRIEQELVDVEKFVWGNLEQPKDSADSVQATAVVEKVKEKKTTRSSRRKTTVKKSAPKAEKSSSSSAPRVSVRRQRR